MFEILIQEITQYQLMHNRLQAETKHGDVRRDKQFARNQFAKWVFILFMILKLFIAFKWKCLNCGHIDSNHFAVNKMSFQQIVQF